MTRNPIKRLRRMGPAQTRAAVHGLRRLEARPRAWLTITRQGALATARRMHAGRAVPPSRKALFVLVGSALIGAGVALFLHARLGLPPYDVMLSAISIRVGITHGQAAWIASGVLFGVAALLGRRPSVWGVAFILLNGVAVDTANSLIADPDTIALRLLFVALGLGAITAGIAVVVHSSATGGPFDLLMAAGADRGLDRRRVRTVLELGALIGGVIAGGRFGLGTVVFALAIGPLIHWVLQGLVDHRAGRDARLRSS